MVVDFFNRLGLEGWLQDKPKEVVVAMASRAVLRTVPLIADDVLEDLRKWSATLALPLFRAIAASWTASNSAMARSVLVPAGTAIHDVAEIASSQITAAIVAAASYACDSAADDRNLADAHVVAAIDVAVTLARRADFWREVTQDVQAIEKGAKAETMMRRGLWLDETPSKVSRAWSKLHPALLSLDQDWQVWIEWYEDRLRGADHPDSRPLIMELERERVLIPDADWEKGPAHVNALIRALEEKYRGTSAATSSPPTAETDEADIPDEVPGLSFGVTSEGLIGIAPSGKLTPEDDIAQIEGLRALLLEALGDLIDVTTGSNAFITINKVAIRYRDAIDGEITELSIDKLYAYGLRLDNASHRLAAEIARGDAPDAGVAVGEALDSVIALHGPSLLSTQRGRQLHDLYREFQQSREKSLAFKKAAWSLAEKIAAADGIVDDEASTVLVESAGDIAGGRQPERSTDLARRIYQNYVVKLAKIATTPSGSVASLVLTEAALQSIPGGLAVDAAATLIDAVWVFLVANLQLFRDFAIAAGQDFAWVLSFLNWLERRSEEH